MINNPYEHYKRMQVETASQGRLIIMLYEGALKNLRTAQSSIAQKNIGEAHNSLMKAQDIIRELNNTLNMSAGEIAQVLRDLYLYMLKRLTEANMQKDSDIVAEVIDLLSTMKEGWDALILKNNRPGANPGSNTYAR